MGPLRLRWEAGKGQCSESILTLWIGVFVTGRWVRNGALSAVRLAQWEEHCHLVSSFASQLLRAGKVLVPERQVRFKKKSRVGFRVHCL